MNLNTQAVHFTADQKLLDYIDSKLGKLNTYYDRILETKVFLKLENSGQVRDKIVEVKIALPGNTMVVTESNKTFEAAVDKAYTTLKRQLIRFKERQRD
jgi:putative sigma-54 modulation protein